MSQFEGGKLRVRCTDCTKLSGNQCTVKKTKVAPKKKRLCHLYEFKGEYENRTPVEASYVPYMDNKTKRLIKRLLKLGIVPVADDGSVETRGGFARTKTLQMPATTATAQLVGNKEQEDPLIYTASDRPLDDPKLIWTPHDESEDNRS
jgi:hypothetical protein